MLAVVSRLSTVNSQNISVSSVVLPGHSDELLAVRFFFFLPQHLDKAENGRHLEKKDLTFAD